MTTVKSLFEVLDTIAPFSDSEPWDNTGLLVGDMNNEVTGVLTALDCHVSTVDEAIDLGANVIVAHHPLIFSKLSAVTESGIGHIIRKLIKHDINLIAMHTNLDHQTNGVSHMIASKLGFEDTEVLLPLAGHFKKLRINITRDKKEQFKENMLKYAPVGKMGEYSEVSFEYEVQGQFKPSENANPTLGKSDELEHVEEFVLECIFDAKDTEAVVAAIYKYHPFETPAFDIITIDMNKNEGLGVSFQFGESLDDLVNRLETVMDRKIVNLVKANDNPINKVAIIGGSGMSYVNDVFKKDVDVLITGDVKYHEAYDAKLAGWNIIDAGHYLEVVMVDGLQSLIEKYSDVTVYASTVNTNPFE